MAATTTAGSSSKKKTTPKALHTKAKKTVSKSDSTGNKKTAQETMLELVAKAYALGKDKLHRDRLTMDTDLAAKTISNNLPKLKEKGWIDFDTKTIWLTTQGLQHMGDLAKRPSSNAERIDMMTKSFTPKQKEMFRLLTTKNGKTCLKDDIAKELGYEHGKVKAFVNLIGSMRGKGVVEYPEPTTIRLTDEYLVEKSEQD